MWWLLIGLQFPDITRHVGRNHAALEVILEWRFVSFENYKYPQNCLFYQFLCTSFQDTQSSFRGKCCLTWGISYFFYIYKKDIKSDQANRKRTWNLLGFYLAQLPCCSFLLFVLGFKRNTFIFKDADLARRACRPLQRVLSSTSEEDEPVVVKFLKMNCRYFTDGKVECFVWFSGSSLIFYVNGMVEHYELYICVNVVNRKQ